MPYNRKINYELDRLSSTESWRLFRIMSEIVEGIEELSDLPPSVSFFGSARTKEEHKHYELTRQIAKLLAENGYGIITGGGGGIMQAANQGAREGNTVSVGLHIDLPMEQMTNPYIDLNVKFHYFFVRKLMFVKHSRAYVVMPGGMGTVDEFAEAFVLIQTEKIKQFPMIFVCREYWKGFFDWVKSSMVAEGYITMDEFHICHFADTPEEVLEILKQHDISRLP